MRKSILLTLVMVSNPAFASDAPTTVYTQNSDEKSAITANCDAPVAGELKCHFTQMTVQKPDEKQAEQRISKVVADFLKAPASEFKGCDTFPAMAEALETGKAPPDVTDKKQFEEAWSKQPPEAKADTTKMMKAFAAFCKTHDRADAEATARAVDEMESSTCTISNSTYDKTFTLNYSTKRWQSTVQNTDSCGTIDYSEFSRPPDLKDKVGGDYFWNYTSKTIVTNPSGKTFLGTSCTTVDQEEHRYTWQTEKFYVNCRYLDIKP